jgi:hypothetical protein
MELFDEIFNDKFECDFCQRFDAFVRRHWKGFLMGFFTLAIWNIIMRWIKV